MKENSRKKKRNGKNVGVTAAGEDRVSRILFMGRVQGLPNSGREKKNPAVSPGANSHSKEKKKSPFLWSRKEGIGKPSAPGSSGIDSAQVKKNVAPLKTPAARLRSRGS